MLNEHQYVILTNDNNKHRAIILLSDKAIKMFESPVKNSYQLKLEAETYCQKQGWEYAFTNVGVADAII